MAEAQPRDGAGGTRRHGGQADPVLKAPQIVRIAETVSIRRREAGDDAARAGREIQEMRLEITTVQRTNADLETKLADLTSTSTMESRALEMGYRPVKPGELDYVAVPGYAAPEPAILLAAKDVTQFSQPIPSEYTQSLIEWFDDRIKSGGY